MDRYSYGHQELSDKAKRILLQAAEGAGSNQGLITFALPDTGEDLLQATPDATGLEVCTAAGETIPESTTNHRTSLEYREAMLELTRAYLAEKLTENTYRLTMLGYRQADEIIETD